MNEITNISPAEKVQRTQTLIAMERLIISLGGRDAYVVWLSAMPESVALNAAGGLAQSSAMSIAENDAHYNHLVKTFANCMLPTMTKLAEQ